jgi:transposase-like protein
VYNLEMRKTFTSKFKVETVIKIFQGEKSISEIASDLEVHPNQLGKWKKQAKEGLEEIFEGGIGKGDKEKEELQKHIQELYAQIGELSTKLSWLKKKSGIKLE